MKFKKIHSKLRIAHFRRKVRQKLGIRAKQLKKRLGLTGVSSAAGLSSDGIYGPTGSIVGRY